MTKDAVKINMVELENVKRVKAVVMEPSENGLTIIGGNNKQGKTSVLDAIAWALGGEKFHPSQADREGSSTKPYLKITLSNGLIVERKGKNSALKVTDPRGEKAGQKLLDSFIEVLALDLPRFMNADNKEKAKTLLKIIGVGDQLAEIEKKEKDTYNERQAMGRIADQKQKYADEMPYFPNMPDDPVSMSELIMQQQEILARNGENQKKRDRVREISAGKDRAMNDLEAIRSQIALLEERLSELKGKEEKQKQLVGDLENDEAIALADAADLQDESTAELEQAIADIEDTNRKVRANLDKAKAEDDARELMRQYEDLTTVIQKLRKNKTELLSNADLPLEGLSVQDGELTYNGQKWDGMSGAEQMIVATAIVRKLNPACKFVLMDKLEQMDMNTLKEFGTWLESEGMQCIATRVSTGDECDLVIEDGYAVQKKDGENTGKTEAKTAPEPKKTWTAGVF